MAVLTKVEGRSPTLEKRTVKRARVSLRNVQIGRVGEHLSGHSVPERKSGALDLECPRLVELDAGIGEQSVTVGRGFNGGPAALAGRLKGLRQGAGVNVEDAYGVGIEVVAGNGDARFTKEGGLLLARSGCD